MSGGWIVRAPGKLFVLGEYAVLDGERAVVAAVDRYVEARIAPARRFRLAAPDLGASTDFTCSDIPAADGPLRFAIAAVRAALLQLPAWKDGADIRIVSDLNSASGTKLGLGGSAAVSTATVTALFLAAGEDPDSAACRDRIFDTALAAHRAAQGGGSGGDVAVSVYGGLRLFTPCADGVPSSTRLALPSSAIFLAGWTGEAASTEDCIGLYRGATNGQRAGRMAYRSASRECVDRFVESLSKGTLPTIALHRACAALDELDRVLGLRVFSPRLRDLVDIANARGAAAKPSGAGGGDCGIALTDDAAIAAQVREGWQQAGIVPLDVRIAEQGVSYDDA